MPFKDRAAKNAYALAWMKQRRADFFDGKDCVRCGSTNQLELDHIDRESKVSHRIWSWSAERRNAEIAKCQVLCTDCHLEKTVSEMYRAPCGTESRYRAGCRCDDCREGHRVAIREWRARRARAA